MVTEAKIKTDIEMKGNFLGGFEKNIMGVTHQCVSGGGWGSEECDIACSFEIPRILSASEPLWSVEG